MATTLKDKLEKLSREDRVWVEQRTRQLLADELSLRQTRQKLNRRQVDVAELMRVGQDNVSRIESRGENRISTVRQYVEALGGTLNLVAEFPDLEPVRIVGVEGVSMPEKSKTKARPRKVAPSTAKSAKTVSQTTRKTNRSASRARD